VRTRNVGVSLVVLVLCASIAGAGTVINFTESGLPSLAKLDGGSDFSGLSFTSDTYLAQLTCFESAGDDSWGILTRDPDGGYVPDNVFTVVFDQPATSVTFDWMTLSSNDIYATAKDEDGNVVLDYSVTGLQGLRSGRSTIGGLAPVKSIEFHDGKGLVGIGRIEFDTSAQKTLSSLAPLPPAAWTGLGLLGALGTAYGIRSRRAK